MALAKLPMTLEEKQEAKQKDPTNVWKSDQANWEYIAIPATNALGEMHASLSVNEYSFEPGQTYKVPPTVAGTLRERLLVYAKECVRVLQPKRDVASEMLVAKYGQGGPGNIVPVDPA